MNFGYVRVSTKDQNPDRQIAKMEELGIQGKYLFIDKESGRHLQRTEYMRMREKLREGDVLFLDSLDRLGRNYEEVKDEWKHLTREVLVDIVTLDMNGVFDSRSFKKQGDIGRFIEDMMLTTLAWVGDQERQKIRERQREGIELAKAAGKYRGRQIKQIDPKLFEEEYKLWKSGQIRTVTVIKHLGITKHTFYRRVRLFENGIDINSNAQSDKEKLIKAEEKVKKQAELERILSELEEKREQNKKQVEP